MDILNRVDFVGVTDTGGLSWISAIDRLPPPDQPIVYRTEFYQSAGHRDGTGCWHFSGGQIERHRVVCWAPLGSDGKL